MPAALEAWADDIEELSAAIMGRNIEKFRQVALRSIRHKGVLLEAENAALAVQLNTTPAGEAGHSLTRVMISSNTAVIGFQRFAEVMISGQGAEFDTWRKNIEFSLQEGVRAITDLRAGAGRLRYLATAPGNGMTARGQGLLVRIAESFERSADVEMSIIETINEIVQFAVQAGQADALSPGDMPEVLTSFQTELEFHITRRLDLNHSRQEMVMRLMEGT